MNGEAKEAMEKAMSLLLYKDRTRRELIDRLVRCGFSEQAVDEAIRYVEGYHYIDDRRYASNYIMFSEERLSQKEIVFKLQKKGVARDIIDEAMLEYHGEQGALQKVLGKRLRGRQLNELSYEEKQKEVSYLVRRGYRYQEIRRCIYI